MTGPNITTVMIGGDDVAQLEARRRALGLRHEDVDRRAGWPIGTARNIVSRGPTYQRLQEWRAALGLRVAHISENVTEIVARCHVSCGSPLTDAKAPSMKQRGE